MRLLMRSMKNTSVNINCYECNGEIVKRVTSTDGSEVESPDNEPTDPNGNGGGQQSGDNSGQRTLNPQYTISVTSADTAQGTASGGGIYSEGSRVNVTATLKSGFQFDKWSDGNTSSSRTINVTQNLSLTASLKAVEQSGGNTEAGGEDGDDEN